MLVLTAAALLATLGLLRRAPHGWLVLPFQLRHLLLPAALPLAVWAGVTGNAPAAALALAACVLWCMRLADARRRAPAPPRDDHGGLLVVTHNAGDHRSDAGALCAWLRGCGGEIVALQEISSEHCARIDDELADIYPHRVLHGAGIAGIGLLSKHPIVEHELFELSSPLPYQRAELDVDGRPLRVLNLHPYASIALIGSSSSAAPDIAVLADLASEHPSTLVLGDFNTTDQTRAYDTFERAGLRDAWRVAGVGRAATFPVPFRYLHLPLPPIVRIDYIWTGPDLAALTCRVGPDTSSDHLPVSAQLAWTRPALTATPAPSSDRARDRVAVD